MRATLLCLLAILTGCGVEPDASADAGPSELEQCTPEDEAECFHGALFVECPGDAPAHVQCQSPHRTCRWVSGCAPTHLPMPGACEPGMDCLIGGFGAGVEPWTRAREMNVRVHLGGAAPEALAQRCRCDDPEVCAHLAERSLCDPPGTTSVWQARVRPEGREPLAGWPMPGMLVVDLRLAPGQPPRSSSDIYAGDVAHLEIDLFAQPEPRARVCVFAWSDGLALTEPACADAGEVHLSEVSTEGQPVVHGTYRAAFSSLALGAWAADGAVTLEGAF